MKTFIQIISSVILFGLSSYSFDQESTLEYKFHKIKQKDSCAFYLKISNYTEGTVTLDKPQVETTYYLEYRFDESSKFQYDFIGGLSEAPLKFILSPGETKEFKLGSFSHKEINAFLKRRNKNQLYFRLKYFGYNGQEIYTNILKIK